MKALDYLNTFTNPHLKVVIVKIKTMQLLKEEMLLRITYPPDN